MESLYVTCLLISDFVFFRVFFYDFNRDIFNYDLNICFNQI